MMNKHLPLGEFERDVRRLADGFEIKPRGIVFERVQAELAAEGADAATPGAGRLLRVIFSKSLSFVGYAAAAASLTVSSVFVVKQKIALEEEQKVLNQLLASRYEKVIPFNTTGSDSAMLSTTLPVFTDTAAAPVVTDHTNTGNNAPVNTADASAKGSVAANEPVSSHPIVSDAKHSSHQQASTSKQNSTVPVYTPKSEAVQVAKYHSTSKSSKAAVPETKVPLVASPLAPQQEPKEQQDLVAQSTTKPEVTNQSAELVAGVKTSVQDNDSQTPVGDVSSAPAATAESKAPVADVVKDTSLTAGKEAAAADDTAAAKKEDAANNQASNAINYKAQELLKKGVWAFAIYHSFDQTKRNLQSNSPAAPEDGRDYGWLQRVNHNVQQSFSSGIKVEYIFSDHFSVGSGINYIVRKDELRAYDAAAYTFDSILGAPLSRPTHFYTPKWVPAFFGGEHFLLSTYHYVDVPLLLNYNNTISGRFGLKLNAGGSYSRLLYANGYYVQLNNPVLVNGRDVHNAPMFYETGRGPLSPVEHNIFNLQGGAYVSYLLNRRAEVFGGFTFKHTLTSLYKKDYEIEQKFNVSSLEIGLRYYVNGK